MSRTVKSTTHSEELVTGVAKLLSDTTHKHSDVQLKVGGKIFHSHKLILAVKSPYFEHKLYPSAAAAAGNDQIVLNDVSADGFDKVLEFMYTGQTELSDQNVEQILRAADLMKLTELRTFCVDYLTDRVSADTCPRYWKLAEQMNLVLLALSCKRLCVKEFGNIRSSSVLSSLSEKMMRELLEDDELVVESEVDMCETLMKWLNSQTLSGNSVQPRQLLTHIRWSGVSVEYVKSKLLTNDVLMRDRQCYEFLSKVVSYRLIGVQFNGLNTSHRPSTGVEQCVVIVGLSDGYNTTSDVYRVSLQRTEHITNMQVIPCSMKTEAAVCVSGNQLYLTGVGGVYIETWRWEYVVGWTRCADMTEGRRRHCATFVNNTSMYVLGGFKDQGEVTLDSIEQYNTVTKKWTKAEQLMHAAFNAGCVVYKTSVYVFGGIGQNNTDLDCVQAFDTATKHCTILTQRLPQPQRLLRAVMWDKSVILINSITCLIFDLEIQTFQQRDQFAAGVVHFDLVLENERIFIIGGDNSQTDSAGKLTWTCSDEVKSVAVMDIINNQTTPNWIHHAKLPTPALVLAYAAMTLPT